MRGRNRVLSLLLTGALVASPILGVEGLTVEAADNQFAGEEWYDQIDTVEVNRESARASFTPYESAEKALANEKSALDDADETGSKWYHSLNGEWNFKYAEKPADRLNNKRGEAAKEYEENWDTEGWDKIKVPSNIQTQKDENGDFKYDTPIYTNQTYPWANYENVDYNTNGRNKPVAPTVKNSVGQYKRTFELPKGWDGRDVFVSFQGVESAFYLYVNGHRVGYAEDSYTADEFNITEYLKEGENTIAVEVYRWSTGSYLENQDFIRLSGIFRDVYLYSKDKVELRDFFVKTDLDDNYENATLTLDADVRSLDPEVSGTYTVKADLYEMDSDTKLWDAPLSFDVEVEAGKATVEERADDKGQSGTGSKEVTNPKKWFADTPNLYRLLIQLVDADGDVVETTCQRVGFREIGKVDINEEGQEQAQINGKKIMFRGTNRHETDLVDGRALTREDIKEDLMTMKQFNINAIRTSHYPNHPYTYALADELGIMMCDEANIESHKGSFDGGADIPSGEPLWNTAVMDRTINMVERDKNHTSVVIWSLGNESTYSTHAMNENYCFYNSTSWILQRDPSRLRKYERDNRYTKGSRENSMVDIYSTQYWDVSSVEGYVSNTANKAPYIQSEYAHAMGNGLGNFKEYWDVFRSYENGQGGFIWDWMDQSLQTKVPSEKEYYVKNDDGTKSAIKGTLQDGQKGKALEGYAIVPSRSAASPAITLGGWVKWNGPTGRDQAIISKGDNGYNLKISKAGDQIEFFVDGWTAGTLTAPFPADKIGEWVYIAGTYENGTYKLYADGQELASKEIAKGEAVDTLEYNIGIGEDPQYAGRTFNGLIDGVRVLNVANPNPDYAPADGEAVYSMDFTDDEIEIISYPEGFTYFGYGGDWGESVTNNDFCSNGIMNADRTPSPELYEVKKVHQEISFYDDGEAKAGKVRIVNEFLNTNLNSYNITWKLLKDNGILAEGELSEEDKNIEAGAEKVVELKGFPEVKAAEGSDYILELNVTLKEDQEWAGSYSGKKGDEIAFEQLALSYETETVRPTIDVEACDDITVEDGDTALTAAGGQAGKDEFTVAIDKTTGYITNYTVNGEVLLKDGPKPDYWRAQISNDPEFTNGMKNAANNFQVESCEVNAGDKVVNVSVKGTIAGIESANTIDYQIYANGDIVVTNRFTPADNSAVGEIAKVGMRMIVPEEYENVTYYGRGPQENWVDRKTGAKVSIYKDTVDNMFEDKYVRPQANGNRSDVRWTTLTKGENGTGIMIAAEDTMNMSALHYTSEDIYKVWSEYGHPYQVPKTDDIVLSVDNAQRGLGNGSCGPGPLGEYTLTRGRTYAQTFRITPVTKEAADANAFVKERMENSKLDLDTAMPIEGITLDGVPIEGFEAVRTEYTRQLLNKDDIVFPEVNAIPSGDDVTVEVEQATPENPTATITATSAYGLQKVYTVTFEVLDQVYISDMEWTVDKAGYSANMRDKCTCGEELGVWVDGQETAFAKGVGSHAPCEVTVNVEGMDATVFRAVAGIGKEQTGNGEVNFVVKVDGKEVFRKDAVKFKTSVPVEVDIRGAKTVSLIAETNGSDGNDHAVWADAKLVHAVVFTDLENALAEYEAIAEHAEDYAQIGFAAYTTAYEAGKVLLGTDAKQDAVDAAVEALNRTKEGLANVAELREKAEGYQALDGALFVEDSYQALQNVVQEALALADDPDASADQVKFMTEALDEAFGNLIPLDENRQILVDILREFKELSEKQEAEGCYTQGSFDAYKTLADQAKEMLNNPDATPEEITELAGQVNGAKDALVDLSVLKEAFGGMESYDEVNYTAKSYEEYQAIVKAAGDVLDNPDASQEEVNAAAESLAKEKLDEVLVDISELKLLVAKAEKADKDDYEEKAWDTLLKEVKKAKELYEEATDEQVEAAAASLKKALDDVKEDTGNPGDPDPQPPIDGGQRPGGGNGSGSGSGSGSGAGKGKGNVKTGDTAHVALWVVLLAAACGGAAFALKKKKK